MVNSLNGLCIAVESQVPCSALPVINSLNGMTSLLVVETGTLGVVVFSELTPVSSSDPPILVLLLSKTSKMLDTYITKYSNFVTCFAFFWGGGD